MGFAGFECCAERSSDTSRVVGAAGAAVEGVAGTGVVVVVVVCADEGHIVSTLTM